MKRTIFLKKNNELILVLKFLEKSFGWKKSHKLNLYNRLILNPAEIPMAAYKLDENKNIIIAILFFYQGKINSSNLDIINCSSWYVQEAYRGIESIKFAKDIINNFSDKILTNYTPSSSAYKIFMALGFKEMSIYNCKFGFSKNFPYLYFFDVFRYFFSDKKVGKICEMIELKSLNMNNINYESCEKILYTVHKLKLFFISFNVTNIYVNNSETHLLSIKNFFLILIKYKPILINIYFRNKLPFLKKTNWLIFYKNKDYLPYVPTIDSELYI